MKAVGYFASITVLTYSLVLLTLYLIFTSGLLGRIAVVALSLAVMYIVSRIFNGNPFKIKPSSHHFDSLKYTLALMFPGYLPPVVAIIVQGPHLQYLTGRPGFVEEWASYLPVYALIFWGLNGIIVAYFYNAVTYELFGERKMFGIFAVTGLVALNYNAPLISNYWNIWDIIFFGTVFAYSYSVKRDPLALSFVYLISEAPLWWCILAPLGEWIFASYFLGRLVLSIVAILIILNEKRTIINDFQN